MGQALHFRSTVYTRWASSVVLKADTYWKSAMGKGYRAAYFCSWGVFMVPTRAARGRSAKVLRDTRWLQISVATVVLSLLYGVMLCSAQTGPADIPNQGKDKQINVNWLYGSYVPKEVSLESLNAHRRWTLYTRQTYTTWGIYIKTTFFAVHDQMRDTYPQWGDEFEGFAKRWGSRHGQFILQNSVISLGDGVVGWEPRYDRCRCAGLAPRIRHAVVRNFVTYDRKRSLRPQIFTYLGAFAGSTVATTWEPRSPRWQVKGYQAVITQVPIGIGINLLGEFAPEIAWLLHRKQGLPH